MTTPAASVDGFPPCAASASPAIGASCHPASAASCGSAPTTLTRAIDVERRLSDWAALLREAARRRLLMRLAEAQAAHKETYSIRKALRAATLEALK